MSMPALKSHLYVTSIPANEEAMFNIMHSTFIMIHIHQTPDENILIKGGQVFTTLLSKYFKTNLKVCVYVLIILSVDSLFYSSKIPATFHVLVNVLMSLVR